MTNEANGGFILDWKKPETIAVGNYSPGYEKENLFSKYPTKIFKSGGTNTRMDMTYAAPWKMTGIAIINHSLSEAGGFFLRFYTDAFVTLDAEFIFPATLKNTFYILDDSIGEYQYIRLTPYDHSQANFQVGVVYPGTAFQFPHNYSWEHANDFNVVKEIDTTDGGFHEETPEENADIQAPEYSTFDINFSSVDSDNYDLYKNLIRVGNKIFIPNFQESDCYYGIVGNKSLKAQRTSAGDTYSLQFLEHSLLGCDQ